MRSPLQCLPVYRVAFVMQTQYEQSAQGRVRIARFAAEVARSEVDEAVEESLEGEEDGHQHEEDEVVRPRRDLVDARDLFNPKTRDVSLSA